MLPRPGTAPPKQVPTVRAAAAERGRCLHASLALGTPSFQFRGNLSRGDNRLNRCVARWIQAQCPGDWPPSVCGDFASDLGIHSDSPAGALDGQRAGDQSPAGSVVCPTSIR
jgi:hypothetical protein